MDKGIEAVARAMLNIVVPNPCDRTTDAWEDFLPESRAAYLAVLDDLMPLFGDCNTLAMLAARRKEIKG